MIVFFRIGQHYIQHVDNKGITLTPFKQKAKKFENNAETEQLERDLHSNPNFWLDFVSTGIDEQHPEVKNDSF